MSTLPVAIALLPVLSFLGVLLYLDSYKLVKLRDVIVVVAFGAATAVATYLAAAQLLGVVDIEFRMFSRYIAPFIEEILKGLLILVMVRTHRIGFLVDAAIYGFAVGTGFALAENLYYLDLFPNAGMGTWILRGFGTAIMHGGATALFAVMGLALLERAKRARLVAFLPGFVIAGRAALAFNHFFLSPLVATVGIVLVLPPLLYAVFQKSERALGNWLGTGFDATPKCSS
jgi:RsiW-degrading membrane proteinase PrsW (M82 family)